MSTSDNLPKEIPVAIVDSDDGDTCYYTCPHCHKRSHSEFDKWCAVITDDPEVPNMICPKCGESCWHPDDLQRLMNKMNPTKIIIELNCNQNITQEQVDLLDDLVFEMLENTYDPDNKIVTSYELKLIQE